MPSLSQYLEIREGKLFSKETNMELVNLYHLRSLHRKVSLKLHPDKLDTFYGNRFKDLNNEYENFLNLLEKMGANKEAKNNDRDANFENIIGKISIYLNKRSVSFDAFLDRLNEHHGIYTITLELNELRPQMPPRKAEARRNVEAPSFEVFLDEISSKLSPVVEDLCKAPTKQKYDTLINILKDIKDKRNEFTSDEKHNINCFVKVLLLSAFPGIEPFLNDKTMGLHNLITMIEGFKTTFNQNAEEKAEAHQNAKETFNPKSSLKEFMCSLSELNAKSDIDKIITQINELTNEDIKSIEEQISTYPDIPKNFKRMFSEKLLHANHYRDESMNASVTKSILKQCVGSLIEDFKTTFNQNAEEKAEAHQNAKETFKPKNSLKEFMCSLSELNAKSDIDKIITQINELTNEDIKSIEEQISTYPDIPKNFKRMFSEKLFHANHYRDESMNASVTKSILERCVRSFVKNLSPQMPM